MNHAFVTGATGLLGNNLVRALVDRNIRVTALVRDSAKAQKQFHGVDIKFVEGDICRPESYRNGLNGCDSIFHTAAYFRDNFKGGSHWQKLYDTNVKGTLDLVNSAWNAGIRRMVHTSSIAVLSGEKNQVIDESMSRNSNDQDDYYRSKILSEQVVRGFQQKHPGMFINFVLPGWMFGPGDTGPTASGQFFLDFMSRKIPGILPATFSVVDARDVAEHEIMAMEKGRNGERYLAAGRHMTLGALMSEMEKVTHIPAPKLNISSGALRMTGYFFEIYHRFTKKPILLSQSSVDLMIREYLRTNFSHEKSQRELGCEFRPLEDTLNDVLNWYKENNYIKF
ncbi:SDR family oxidoreductase [Klebsiella michiganensis]|nr:SDR family oxidoreductase [Klebsiella michiganensis]HBU6430620.1 SDR family oxidoreductase [Klebsiella oxytoca]